MYSDRSVKANKIMTRIQISDLLNTGDEIASSSQAPGQVRPSQILSIQDTDPAKKTKGGPEKEILARMEAMCMSNSPRAVDGVIAGFIESTAAIQKNVEVQYNEGLQVAKPCAAKFFSSTLNKAEVGLKREKKGEDCVAEQPFLKQILEDLIAKSTSRQNGCSDWSREQKAEEAVLAGGSTLAKCEQTSKNETLVLPNVYVRRSEMDWVMDVSTILPNTCVDKSLSDSDAFEVDRHWKVDASVRERREKRRIAARAARVEKEDKCSDDEMGGGWTVKALEKRMKNRAAVNKCRLKQRERIGQFEREQRDLERENRMMREALRLVEEWEALSNFANV